jgi:hypothetical protein
LIWKWVIPVQLAKRLLDISGKPPSGDVEIEVGDGSDVTLTLEYVRERRHSQGVGVTVQQVALDVLPKQDLVKTAFRDGGRRAGTLDADDVGDLREPALHLLFGSGRGAFYDHDDACAWFLTAHGVG